MPMTAASVIRSANNRLMPGLPGSNRDPLDLIEAHLACVVRVDPLFAVAAALSSRSAILL